MRLLYPKLRSAVNPPGPTPPLVDEDSVRRYTRPIVQMFQDVCEALERAPVPLRVLNVDLTLSSGQAFRWRRKPGGEWVGTIGSIGVHLKPAADGLYWQTAPERDRWDVIARYFALDVDLEALQAQWIRREPRMKAVVEGLPGLRVLRQDVEEVLFSFLCASCNTVTKISRTMQALEHRYGDPVAEVAGELLRSFPRAGKLAAADEADLRGMLWGYRAPSLLAVARFLKDRGDAWLASLRERSYLDARFELMKLPGIGRKIADCICLFGLGHNEAVPVDTHIRKVATCMFAPQLASCSLTERTYDALASVLRERFGAYAGWAQQYLFCHSRATQVPSLVRKHS